MLCAAVLQGSGLQWCSHVGRASLRSNKWYGRLRGLHNVTKTQRKGWKLLYLAVPAGLTAHHVLKPSCVAAYCKQKQIPVGIKRLANTPSRRPQPFDWKLFLQFALPDLALLLVAVGVSVPSTCASTCQLAPPPKVECSGSSSPQYLHSPGTRHTHQFCSSVPARTGGVALPQATGPEWNTTYVSVHAPGGNCTSTCMSPHTIHAIPPQALSTFVYITVLSISGERIAVRIRKALFNAIIKQDIDFFDSCKTGELISRYVCAYVYPPSCLPLPLPPGCLGMCRNSRARSNL